MELHERVELALWALRRSIERSRYLQIASAQLAARTLLRQQADRLGDAVWWMDAVEPQREPEES